MKTLKAILILATIIFTAMAKQATAFDIPTGNYTGQGSIIVAWCEQRQLAFNLESALTAQ